MKLGIKASGLAYVAAFAVALNPQPAVGWGAEGHRITALIAAQRLTPAARTLVSDLLGMSDAAQALETYSTWADEIRPMRRDTAPWHFVNIELASQGYVATRDCPDGDCVVAQIDRDTSILHDTALAKAVRAEALRFLIHFVGDIHQPLHCADNHDRGGNDVLVQVGGQATNLHAVWDRNVVEALGRNPDAVASRLEARLTPREVANWQRGSAAAWATEGFRIAKQAIYPRVGNGGRTDVPVLLGADYAWKMSPLAATQLEKAGVRLAAILNEAGR